MNEALSGFSFGYCVHIAARSVQQWTTKILEHNHRQEYCITRSTSLGTNVKKQCSNRSVYAEVSLGYHSSQRPSNFSHLYPAVIIPIGSGNLPTASHLNGWPTIAVINLGEKRQKVTVESFSDLHAIDSVSQLTLLPDGQTKLYRRRACGHSGRPSTSFKPFHGVQLIPHMETQSRMGMDGQLIGRPSTSVHVCPRAHAEGET